MKTTRELQARVRACANAHHDLLLEILLFARKSLKHNMVLLEKHTQETNWKQNFEKLQNENICLINLNVENLCKPRVEPNDGAVRAKVNLFAVRFNRISTIRGTQIV